MDSDGRVICTACGGDGGVRFVLGEWISCWPCRGSGWVSLDVKRREREEKLRQMYENPTQCSGDILYGKGEKWGPV